MKLLGFLLFVVKVMKKGGFSPYWTLKWSDYNIIGGSIGSTNTKKKVSKCSLMDGIFIASLRGTFPCIFDNAPSKSKFRSTLPGLDVLGRSTSKGGVFS
jgi:hypothetical protein